jgi:exosortase family protein XrtM
MARRFLALQARGAGALIRPFDDGAIVSGTKILGRFPLEIVRSCSSLDAQALYAATVLAFPARITGKLLGLALGIVVLTVLNMARIASLYFIGAGAPSVFDAAHEELLPFVLIAVACACFTAWAHWALRGERARAAV